MNTGIGEDYEGYLDRLNDSDKFSDIPSLDYNPFREKLNDAITMKRKMKGAVNRVNGMTLIDNDTGEEISGIDKNVVFVKKEYVDNEKFLKVYSNRLKELFDLTNAAMKVFGYFMVEMQKVHNKNKDMVYFNLKDCMEFCGYNSHKQVYRGLTELILNKFIAKCSTPPNHFWIDCRTAFNGDRIFIMEEHVRKQNDHFDDKSLTD
jgi:hypothetical protein